MRYFVIFATDKPGMSAVRQEVRPRHRQYLRSPGQHRVKVLLGGPTLTADQRHMNGTVLVVQAECMDDVMAFVHDDPYTLTNLFSAIDVRPWEWSLGMPGGDK